VEGWIVEVENISIGVNSCLNVLSFHGVKLLLYKKLHLLSAVGYLKMAENY
jgi:hypothetical protein